MPPVANGDPSAAVIRKCVMLGIAASVPHIDPGSIQRVLTDAAFDLHPVLIACNGFAFG